MRPIWPLLALAVGAFGIGTTEFAPMGLLPVIAAGLHVSIPKAGFLVSSYALGVMIGAPLMTFALARVRRNAALIVLMAIFTGGNLLSALAQSYDALLISRVVTSLAHGAFFGLGAIVATKLVPPDKRASAVATMFMGLTIANIAGVPAAALIGEQIGWRLAFAATAGVGLLSMAILFFAVPREEAGAIPDLRRELAILRRPEILTALLTTVLSAGAMFTLYTYVVPILFHLTDIPHAIVTMMLVLIGIGFTIGNVFGGKLADRSPDRALMIFLVFLVATSLVFSLVAAWPLGAAVCLLLWGTAAFAVVPPVQMRVMRIAHEAPGLASSINIGAFNLGNAVGAAVGGWVIDAGWGYDVVPVAGAGLAAGGLLLVIRRDLARCLPGRI